jgi:transposase
MLSLTTKQRDELLTLYRKDPDPELRFRAHIILLLGQGRTWDTIEAILFCSSRTVDRWLKRFQAEGAAGLAGRKRGRPFRLGAGWVAVLVSWVTTRAPSDFGFLRSRWSCAVLTLLLRERHGAAIGREAVRRMLHRGHLVYRRPRPVPPPNEEQRRVRLAGLRGLLEGLPADETAVWQDEVEVNTNPEIGRMWMRRGQQATLPTPGTNRKRHVAGSIHWRTGRVFATAGPKRDEELFLAHLDELRHRLRRYRKIHVICDRAKFHRSEAVMIYLWEHRERIELELLPAYSPDANPMERVWWLLREHVTRNHRCRDRDELMGMVMAYLESEAPFRLEDEEYQIPKAA